MSIVISDENILKLEESYSQLINLEHELLAISFEITQLKHKLKMEHGLAQIEQKAYANNKNYFTKGR